MVYAEKFSFGLWGDMPYQKNGDMEKLPNVIKSLNHSDIAFSIHNGDIKDGSSTCDDEKYHQMYTLFNQLENPVIYTVGDNEWTDCHRTNNGSYDPLERLSFLRQIFFKDNQSLGKKTLTLEQQGENGQAYIENSRFMHQDILFINIHMPGSNNNYVASEQECIKNSKRQWQDCEKANQEYIERDKANILWLQQGFKTAKEKNALGIVITVQADPGFDLPETEQEDESQNLKYSGYRKFMQSIVAETENYTGQVLFVHCDTHYFKIDKPLYQPSKMLNNFTRIETFGSPHLNWVKVNVDTSTPHIFNIHPVIVKH